MKLYTLAATLFAALALVGCAHPIVITPNATKLMARDAAAPPKVKAKVAYYISETARAQEVTTAGGGGDKVTSVPYRDLDSSLYIMLGNVFDGVTRLKTLDDKEALRSANIAYIITPELTVSSSSSSAFTWPPTDFGVDLTCKVSDVLGNVIDSPKVVGAGHAEFSEFKSDFALSSKRASEDALLKMQAKLIEMNLPGM